ncbi:MAG: conjugal transfer protein TraX [Treponema sp.]|jgi:hypothetical protein|nr:conjugal transfer protein TraX [Treponema sp.]
MSFVNDDNSGKTLIEGQKKKWLLLSGGGVKAIGLILMVMDHLHQMFVNQGIPIWFNWLGRPVAAMFLFLCAEGYYYTHNKKVYILRFLGAFILMNFVNWGLNRLLYVENVALINNVFGTLFMSAFYMLMTDLFRKGVKERKPGRILLAVGGFLLPAAAGFVLVSLLSGGSNLIAILLFFLIPTPLTVEGSFFLVIVGASFYILRKYRWAQVLVPVAAGLFVLLTSWGESGIPDTQWLMFTAALPILLYNGQRGRGGKYFFYVFYPAHIYLFYLIAWLLQRFSLF